MGIVGRTLITCALLAALPSRSWADAFFSTSEVAEFMLMSRANVCRERCTFSKPDSKSPNPEYTMQRLEVLPFAGDRQVYLVERTRGCGSAGCESAVFVREGQKLVRIEERFGLDRDTAERIARSALGLSASVDVARTSVSSGILMTALIAVVYLGVATISRPVVDDRPILQRILINSATTVISSLALSKLGVVDDVTIFSIPLVFGVSVGVFFSLRDAFG